MKNLDNLIEDIYSKLSVLGEGKPLDASAEDIDALGESIKKVLHHWANPSPRSSDMLRMSNIGKPTRQLWYDLKSENESAESLPAPVFIKFLYDLGNNYTYVSLIRKEKTFFQDEKVYL